MITKEKITKEIYNIASKYYLKKVELFGSMANNTATEKSDIDLLVEFTKPISLITLSSLKIELEEVLDIEVDIIHGPLSKDSYIKIEKTICIYEKYK